MTAENDILRLDVPTHINEGKKGLCPATRYPNHRDEAVKHIGSEIPRILDKAACKLLSQTPVDHPVNDQVAHDVWNNEICLNIVQAIKGNLDANMPDLSKHFIDLLKMKGSDFALVETLKNGLTYGDRYYHTILNSTSSKNYVPRELQPIIVENGIVGIIPTNLVKEFRAIYTSPRLPVSLPALYERRKLREEDFRRDYGDINARVNCMGKSVTEHIIHSTALNYSLKLLKVDHHITSIGESGHQRSFLELDQEYTSVTS